jgi:hypothetical protein
LARLAASAARRACSVAAISVRSCAASSSVRTLSQTACPSALRKVRAISTDMKNSSVRMPASGRCQGSESSLATRTMVGVSTSPMKPRNSRGCDASSCTEPMQ